MEGESYEWKGRASEKKKQGRLGGGGGVQSLKDRGKRRPSLKEVLGRNENY